MWENLQGAYLLLLIRGLLHYRQILCQLSYQGSASFLVLYSQSLKICEGIRQGAMPIPAIPSWPHQLETMVSFTQNPILIRTWVKSYHILNITAEPPAATMFHHATWSTRETWRPSSCALKAVSVHEYIVQSVQFSRSVVSNSLWPHELQQARPPCPSPTPGA